MRLILVAGAIAITAARVSADPRPVGFAGGQDLGPVRTELARTAVWAVPTETMLDAGGFFAEHHTPAPATDCAAPLCVGSMVAVGRAWVDDSYQATIQI